MSCGSPPPTDWNKFSSDVRQKFQQGSIDAALAELESGLKATEKANPEWNYNLRILKAEIFISRHKNLESLALLDPPRPSVFPSREFSVRRKTIQGRALCALRRFDQAKIALQEAEQLAVTTAPELSGEVKVDQGTLALVQDDKTAAGEYFHQALSFARKYRQVDIEAEAQGSLGGVAIKLEHYDEAIDWLKEALNLTDSIHALSLQAVVLLNLGWGHLEMGDYDEAVSYFTKAEKLSADIGLKLNRQNSLIQLGNIHLAERNYFVAEEYFSRALAIAKELKSEPSVAVCLNDLALASLGMGEMDKAETYNQEALAIKRKNHNHPSELESLLTDAEIADAKRDFRRAKPLLLQLIHSKEGSKSLHWGAEAELANFYVAQRQVELAEYEFQKVLRMLDSLRCSLEHDEYKQAFSTMAAKFYSHYISFLVDQKKTVEALQVAELSRARTLEEGLKMGGSMGPPKMELAGIQHFLKKNGQIILSYWLAPEGPSFFWVVTSSQIQIFPLPSRQEIEQEVDAYRKSLLGSSDLGNADVHGVRLYQLLVQPAERFIPHASRVVIIPDGGLNKLNFETLRVPVPGPHYWIKDVEIENASSIVLLTRTKERRLPPLQELLLIGNPVQANNLYPVLAHAGDEIKWVSGRFSGKKKIIEGKEATPSAYRLSHPEQFQYIHLVTHGTASELIPLESAIILSPERENSYKLYARDIVNIPLHADIVTISACYGASGRIYGEGLVGLVWAFMRAGAHHVIAGLWEVDDLFTPKLMNDFYGQMNAGKKPADALRSAKLAMIQSGSIYRRPYYWASLQLYTR